jgi:predicted Zn-dependent protease
MMSVPAQALNIIRDTQIEKTLEVWSAPILKEAGLSNDQVRLVLVNSDQVNAFVAGGANIFIYAGLIEKAEYPEEIKGVIAHEIGHITGGHLIAGRKAIERASFQSILATALGIGAAILTGDGRAAAAISAGGSGAATAGFLSHSRIQESAADQAGFQYMEDAGVNPQGIVSFLEKLEGQELLPASQQS